MPRSSKKDPHPEVDLAPPEDEIPTGSPRTDSRVRCWGCELIFPKRDLVSVETGGRLAWHCGTCWTGLLESWRTRTDRPSLDSYYRRKYGIGLDRYGEMLLAQGGCCSICRSAPTNTNPLAVDHDHTTGAVRGLLCRHCNVALGGFKDDIRLLAGAIVYLEQHR